MRDVNQQHQDGDLPEFFDEDATEVVGEDGKPLVSTIPSVFREPFRTLKEKGVKLNDFPPKRRWLLTINGKGALPLGKVGVLAAGGGTGKTQALCQLALVVALGVRSDEQHAFWLDAFRVETPGKVLLALGEEDDEEIQRRLHRAAAAMGFSAAEAEQAAARIVALPLCGIPCALTSRDRQGNTEQTELLGALRERLAEQEWSLVILDPMSRFAGEGVETDNTAATRFMQAVESLVTVNGTPTVLVAHHSSKQSKREGEGNVRGSSAIEDAARWVAVLDKTTENRVVSLRLHKTNYTLPWPKQYLAFDDEGAFTKASAEVVEALNSKPPPNNNTRKNKDAIKASTADIEDLLR